MKLMVSQAEESYRRYRRRGVEWRALEAMMCPRIELGCSVITSPELRLRALISAPIVIRDEARLKALFRIATVRGVSASIVPGGRPSTGTPAAVRSSAILILLLWPA